MNRLRAEANERARLGLSRPRGKIATSWKEYEWGGALPFVLVHLAVLGALWTGATWKDWVCCFFLYAIRMFGVTGGYHRYFSHRSFKTSRVGQFLLAFLAQTSAQRGALWWASHHRLHHRLSDEPGDVHSPKQHGLLYAHLGWLFDYHEPANLKRMSDFARFPELRFLDRFWLLPPVVLGVAVWALLGWSGLWIGFCLSTVFLWHGTFTVNSLAHVIGKQRFKTTDESKNSWLIAIITLGEGWHNNHHHYEVSARQGFRWWEIDVTYYVLWTLSKLGIVWDLKQPPKHMLVDKAEDKAPQAVSQPGRMGAMPSLSPRVPPAE